MKISKSNSQVVSEQLHNECAILVAVFTQRIQFGDGVVEGLLGQVARSFGRVQNFVVKHGEVQGKTETDWVC